MMKYQGRYQFFDTSQIKTYPVSERANRVTYRQIHTPETIKDFRPSLPPRTIEKVKNVADHIIHARKKNRPVVFFTGGHLIKNGFGRLLGDLIEKGFITLVGGQGSTAIHDFELALIGETSEYVPKGLEEGRFGMAFEFTYFNTAMQVGNIQKLGLGETLGRMMCDQEFCEYVCSAVVPHTKSITFSHPELSMMKACYSHQVPCCILASIGTDVIDQHHSFDGEAKGGCSGRDFLIFTHVITQLENGGVIINMGSAVTGPEVFLKSVSMASNIGKAPKKLVTANFDLRDYNPQAMTDEKHKHYYFRDQKSIVTRIPEAYGGAGFYIQGDQCETFPLLYNELNHI